MSILIVEDDPVSSKILELNLRRHGYQTIAARTGKEALECLSSTPDIQLIMADIMMPEMNGLELLGKIREHPEWKEIPVVMCTALSDSKTVEKAVELGCRHYVTKPIHIGPMLRKVHEALEGEVEKTGGSGSRRNPPSEDDKRGDA
ncbi:MAG: response regulator [Candidatus Latescibacteria bacterium]|nr:response regulator [Candidatus Latescibacterota bacterium]